MASDSYRLVLSVYIIAFSSIYISYTSGYSCESLSYRTGVTVHCEHPGTKESVDCQSGKVPVGTDAQYYCDDFYFTQDGDRSGGTMKCDDQGNWTPQQHFRAFSCSIDCGRLRGPTTSTYWPWHAAVFTRENSNAAFKYACGGTLINPFNSGFVIITTARCFQNRGEYEIDPRNIKVSMGLVTTDFQVNAASEEVKTFSVKTVALENLGALALLKLDQDVQLDRNIVPACFNGNSDVAAHQLQEGTPGKLVGFGELRDHSHPATLRSISLKVSQTLQCPAKVHAFCAGNAYEDRNICSGDSGSGLLFSMGVRNSQRSYLQGVLTELLEENRDCKSTAFFTRVNDFAPWIKETTIQLNEGLAFQQRKNKPNRNPLPETSTEFHGLAFQRETPPPTVPPLLRPVPTVSQKYKPISNTGNHRERPVPVSNIQYPSGSSSRPSSQLGSNSGPRIPESLENTSVFNIKDYELVGVDWHNYYRAKHGSAPLTLNHTLSREAQAEADRSLQENKYKFEGFTNYFGINGGNLNSTKVVQEAITDWYKTSANYDYSNPRSIAFANIVWRATTEIGVGVARKGAKQIVVVKYNRPLTIEGEQEKSFRENVRRPLPYN